MVYECVAMYLEDMCVFFCVCTFRTWLFSCLFDDDEDVPYPFWLKSQQVKDPVQHRRTPDSHVLDGFFR